MSNRKSSIIETDHLEEVANELCRYSCLQEKMIREYKDKTDKLLSTMEGKAALRVKMSSNKIDREITDGIKRMDGYSKLLRYIVASRLEIDKKLAQAAEGNGKSGKDNNPSEGNGNSENGSSTPGTGETRQFPQPGDSVSVSFGTDKPGQNMTVSRWNSFSIECSKLYADNHYPIIASRLDYLAGKYPTNANESGQLLTYMIDGKECYAGAMVEGFGEPGDIVLVELDDGHTFYMVICDVKSTSHSSDDLAKNSSAENPQCQIDGVGHGYKVGENTVQICACEFFVTSNIASSATNYPNGQFLKQRSVRRATVVGHTDMQ